MDTGVAAALEDVTGDDDLGAVALHDDQAAVAAQVAADVDGGSGVGNGEVAVQFEVPPASVISQPPVKVPVAGWNWT